MSRENFFMTRGRELNLTQRDVAEALPLKDDGRTWTPAAIGTWCRGEVAPPVELADELAAIYRVSRDRILKEIHAVAVAIRGEEKSAASAK